MTVIYDRCLIDGDWLGSGDVPVLNPATGRVLARVPNLGRAEAEQAIAAASRAFPPWSGYLAKQRAALLRHWHDLIMARQEELARLLTAEQGKPLSEARDEIAYAAAYVEFYAEEAKRICGESPPSHLGDARVVVLRQAVGVVGAITPWNFPAAMVTRKVAPALAVGCTVVLKPAMETPLTALALAALAHEAGLPAGALNVVTGDAVSIGAALCECPEVRSLTFTGSTAVGRTLMAQCAPTVKRLGLELGGNAPFIVFPDADLDAAVEGALVSKYRNAGQTCICANRIFVHDAVYEPFVARLADAVAALEVGDGMMPGVQQGPLISEAAVCKVESHIADAVDKGARVVTGGQRHRLGGTFFEPTVLAGATAEMAVTKEETFGPLAPIYCFRSDEEVIALANATECGLAAYFYARSLRRVWQVAEALDYGMVAVNSARLSSELAPFGGIKQSGFGREGSRHGTEEFTYLKYVLLGGL